MEDRINHRFSKRKPMKKQGGYFMKAEQLALFLISPDSMIVDAMKRIDRNARGILFVTNEQQKLLGVVTDGDIRRWLIRTGELKAPVSGLMNTEPKKISRKEHAKAPLW